MASTTEERAKAALRRKRLVGIIKQLKKRGEWDSTRGPKGGLAELGRLVVDINERPVSSTSIKRWLKDSGEDISWVRGYSGEHTVRVEPAKARLKALIDSGDYPKNLEELGKMVADEGSAALRPSTISRWLKGEDYPENLLESWTKKDQPNKKWTDENWTKWQDASKLELEGDSPFAKMFRDSPDHLKERYRDSVKNRDALKIEGRRDSEYRMARRAIDAHSRRPHEGLGGSGSFKKSEDIPDYDTWEELFGDAKSKAYGLFGSFIKRGRGRSLNLLRNPREANYIYNLFLRAQIEHLANKQPLKQMSHGYARKGVSSEGAKSSGLNNALQVFLENWHPNIVRGSLNVEEKLKSGKPDLGWLRWKDAEKRYNIYSLRRDVPIADARQVLGDLPLSGKWKNERIPWLELGSERLSSLTSLTFGKILEDIQELYPEQFSQGGELIQQVGKGTMKAYQAGERTPYTGQVKGAIRSGVPMLKSSQSRIGGPLKRKTLQQLLNEVLS